VFIIKVKSKYFAMSGSTSDVGGRILDTSSRNTTSDSRMLMPNVTWKEKCSKAIIIVFYPILSYIILYIIIGNYVCFCF
jgi:hypothetical protein